MCLKFRSASVASGFELCIATALRSDFRCGGLQPPVMAPADCGPTIVRIGPPLGAFDNRNPNFPRLWEPKIPNPSYASASPERTSPAVNFSFNRYELPRMFGVAAWCSSQSKIAETMARSPNTSPKVATL